MALQEFIRASPECQEGGSIARRVLADIAAFYIDNGGPALARQHVKSVAHELIIYSDCAEAREALAYIRERDENKEELRTSEPGLLFHASSHRPANARPRFQPS